jgi:acyl carrier protein
MMEQQFATQSAPDLALENHVATLIVSALNLDMAAEAIQPLDPLYGEPLGLDSIDILEVALVLSKEFGVQMKADGEDNFKIFASLRNLTGYISEHRTK